jgi:hypothetical protein
VDQKWRDSLNVAAAEPAHMAYSTDIKKNIADSSKKRDPEQSRKGQAAEVNTAGAEVTEKAPRV